jgi:YD repeat-containing protein
MVVNIPQLGNAGVYGYRYDQLNRIKGMNSFKGFDNATNTLTPAAVLDYRERVSYDPNGNIQTYNRSGDAARFSMDSMTYTYKANKNQLDRVADAAADVSLALYPNYNDIKQGQATGNYQYDAIGNLISDAAEGITNISWTVYGKIQSITKTINAVTTVINYGYDASGNRISKAVTVGGTTTNTIYVRDASGNTMAVYTKDAAINSGAFTQTEISLYGSSRLGVWNINRNLTTLTSIDYSNYRGSFTRGNKLFELANHLGNVLVTVTDKKIGVDVAPQNGIIDYGVAEVVTANDYYPGGMQMPGRKFSPSSYRYGFNGQEKSDEIFEGSTTAEYWEYDSRIGRRWNIDPKPTVGISDYSTLNNNPICYIDILGDTGRVPLKFKLQPVGGYPGEGLDNLITKGIQWLGHKISGGNVTKSTSVNIQLATSLVVVIASKGKNNKADEELVEQIIKKGSNVTKGITKELPTQIHHFATNKSKTFTPRMKEIAEEFELSLNGAWNKQALPHLGRHPNDYHNFVLQGMQNAKAGAGGSQAEFLNLFNQYVKEPVIQNPGLLRKSGW